MSIWWLPRNEHHGSSAFTHGPIEAGTLATYKHTYACIHFLSIWMCVYTSVCIYTYLHIHASRCATFQKQKYMYACVHIYIYMYMGVCLHIYICVCVCKNIHIYIYTRLDVQLSEGCPKEKSPESWGFPWRSAPPKSSKSYPKHNDIEATRP